MNPRECNELQRRVNYLKRVILGKVLSPCAVPGLLPLKDNIW